MGTKLARPVVVDVRVIPLSEALFAWRCCGESTVYELEARSAGNEIMVRYKGHLLKPNVVGTGCYFSESQIKL